MAIKKNARQGFISNAGDHENLRVKIFTEGKSRIAKTIILKNQMTEGHEKWKLR